MRTLSLILISITLAGCAATAPTVKVEYIDKPVYVTCVKEVPDKPRKQVLTGDHFAMLTRILIEKEEQKQYTEKLEVIVKGCQNAKP